MVNIHKKNTKHSYGSVLLLSRDKKDKDNEDRRDKTEKKNRKKIVFGNDVQDKMIISISCLVIVDKTIKSFNMYCCQTFIF
jgi:RNA processing factor Prp31